jgi:hypothetical protein
MTEENFKRLMAPPVPEAGLPVQRDITAAGRFCLTGEPIFQLVPAPILAHGVIDRCACQNIKPGDHTKFSKRASTFLLLIPDLMVVASGWGGIVRTKFPHTYPWYVRKEGRQTAQRSLNKMPGKNCRRMLEKECCILHSLPDFHFISVCQFRQKHALLGLMHGQIKAEYKIIRRLNTGFVYWNIQRYRQNYERRRKKAVAGSGNQTNSLSEPRAAGDDYTLSPQHMPEARMYSVARRFLVDRREKP